MKHVKNVSLVSDSTFVIECYKGTKLVSRFYITPEDFSKFYPSFGFSRRFAEYVSKQFEIKCNEEVDMDPP